MILNPIVKPQTGGAKNSSVSPSFSSGWMLGVWRPIWWCRSFWHFLPKMPQKKWSPRTGSFPVRKMFILGIFLGFHVRVKQGASYGASFFRHPKPDHLQWNHLLASQANLAEELRGLMQDGERRRIPRVQGLVFRRHFTHLHTLCCFGTFRNLRKPSCLSKVSS